MTCWMGVGRLGKDVDMRYTKSGQAVARVLLAIARYGKDGRKTTDWVPLVLWGKNAINTSQFAGKGNRVAVTGSISSEFWERETEAGKKSQLSPEIVVERIDFVDPPGYRPSSGAAASAAQNTRGGKAA